MSLRAAQALGADYCGVDLMRGEDGLLYLVEVNSKPAWEGLQKVCAEDVAGQIVAYLARQIE
jgi:glutathione synthase/RimK-type ligase-like ATP-grasp enzyme